MRRLPGPLLPVHHVMVLAVVFGIVVSRSLCVCVCVCVRVFLAWLLELCLHSSLCLLSAQASCASGYKRIFFFFVCVCVVGGCRVVVVAVWCSGCGRVV